jgi:hypothetical protein
MAIYSLETRFKLAKWVKYAIYINIVLFLMLVFFAYIESDASAATVEAGKNFISLLVFTFAAYLVMEKLRKPEDDFWRKIAEVLGTIQVCSACLGLVIIGGAFIFGLYAGLTGISLDIGPKPVATYNTVAIVTITPQSEGCIMTSSGCIPIPPSPTIPPYGNKLWQNDPIIGSFVFNKSQFEKDEIYYSRLGNSEYNYQVVPLDYSPDIKWTFRDDGIILFYDIRNGNLLRTGTWSKDDYGEKSEYKIKRGNWDYRITYQKGVFQVTRPNVWNLIKTG